MSKGGEMEAIGSSSLTLKESELVLAVNVNIFNSTMVEVEVISEVKRIYPNMPLVGVGAILIRYGKILLEKRKHDLGKGNGVSPVVWSNWAKA